MKMYGDDNARLHELAREGNIEELRKYRLNVGGLNVLLPDENGEPHSIIWSALKNEQYKTAIWLKDNNCTLKKEEQEEIDAEYIKQRAIYHLASPKLKDPQTYY